ncbi:MAG: cation:proton antiporter [Candidatus Brocadiales bacterium]|nr:cation:proton antiporter [Candidatus Brocadiales bacterium]
MWVIIKLIMGNAVPSIKLDDQTASPEAKIVAEGMEEASIPGAEGLEAMKPPVATADVEDPEPPADEDLSDSEGKTVTAEETNEVPGGLSAPEEKDSPSGSNKESVLATTEKEPSVVSMDEDTVAGVKEPLSVTTDKEHLPTTADVESPAEEESHLVATDKESPDILPTPTDKEGFTVIYKDSPPVNTVEAPSVTADKGPLSVDEEPPSATAYKESPPTVAVEEPPSVFAEKAPEQVVAQPEPPATMEEEYPPIVTYKEHPPAVSVEEPPSTTTEEVAGIIERISGPEPVVVPPEPPAEVIEEVPPWEIWHTDPTGNILLGTAIILAAAKIGGETARLFKLPPMVGKVFIGMVLGNIYFLTGWDFFNFLRAMPFLKMLSHFGALTLLLTAGLHTDLGAVLRVGVSSTLVCLGGIVAPGGLGLLLGYFLLPDAPMSEKLLLAVIMCCTSTGALLFTLRELKVINTLEGRVLLGGTVLTDITVFLAFSIVSGIVVRGGVPLMGVMISVGIASLFLTGILIASLRYGEKVGDFMTRKIPEGLKISIVAILCLLLAFLTESIGLQTVIGAYAAGLLLRNMRLKDTDDREYNVEWIIRPAYMLLVPMLFVRAGAMITWESFLNIETVFLGLAVAGAAILGKLFCGVCPLERGINRLAIGVGMAIKLEMTLILAGIGRDMGILNDAVFSSFMMVIILTSTIGPFLLKLILSRKEILVPETPLSPLRVGLKGSELR